MADKDEAAPATEEVQQAEEPDVEVVLPTRRRRASDDEGADGDEFHDAASDHSHHTNATGAGAAVYGDAEEGDAASEQDDINVEDHVDEEAAGENAAAEAEHSGAEGEDADAEEGAEAALGTFGFGQPRA